MNSIWQQITKKIESQISPINYAMWIHILTFVSLDDNFLIIEAPTKTNRNYFLENYKETVEEILQDLLNTKVTVKVIIKREIPSAIVKKEVPSDSENSSNLQAVRTYNLDNYLRSPENNFLYQAALQVVENPGKWNPLFVYGLSGTGKTRILRSIANEYIQRNRKVRYFHGNSFFNLYITATRKNGFDKFYDVFRGLNLLIIDDIQFFKGKLKTQETFFHIFNSLFEKGIQIIISADRKPSEIEGVDEALRSRLISGLLMETVAPGYELRLKAIQTLSEDIAGFTPEMAEYLADLPFSTLREIEGLILRLRAFSELTQNAITYNVIDSEIEKLKVTKIKTFNVEEIQKAVCDYFDVSESELISSKRVKRISRPRQVAMYLSKKHTDATYPQIGDLFHRKSHSTVHNAVTKIETLKTNDRALLKDIEALEKKLKS